MTGRKAAGICRWDRTGRSRLAHATAFQALRRKPVSAETVLLYAPQTTPRVRGRFLSVEGVISHLSSQTPARGQPWTTGLSEDDRLCPAHSDSAQL